MASSKKRPKLTNVELSIEHIKRYFDAFPSGEMTDDLKEKKEHAETALDYLAYFYKRKITDVLIASPCGPKPHIPELP